MCRDRKERRLLFVKDCVVTSAFIDIKGNNRHKSVQNKDMEAIVEMVLLEHGWDEKESCAGHRQSEGKLLAWLQYYGACHEAGHQVDQEGRGDKYFCCPQRQVWAQGGNDGEIQRYVCSLMPLMTAPVDNNKDKVCNSSAHTSSPFPPAVQLAASIFTGVKVSNNVSLLASLGFCWVLDLRP